MAQAELLHRPALGPNRREALGRVGGRLREQEVQIKAGENLVWMQETADGTTTVFAVTGVELALAVPGLEPPVATSPRGVGGHFECGVIPPVLRSFPLGLQRVVPSSGSVSPAGKSAADPSDHPTTLSPQ